ncbi:response regulator transcription factor [Chloroflexota bacterium]
MKILMVDDERPIYTSISILLELRYPEAELVYSGCGEAGLEMARTAVPDLVILDLGLPDISGFEVLKRLRTFSKVPVMILSVHGQRENMNRARLLGADDYVTKPFQPDMLARIKSIAEKTSTERYSVIRNPLPVLCLYKTESL